MLVPIIPLDRVSFKLNRGNLHLGFLRTSKAINLTSSASSIIILAATIEEESKAGARLKAAAAARAVVAREEAGSEEEATKGEGSGDVRLLQQERRKGRLRQWQQWVEKPQEAEEIRGEGSGYGRQLEVAAGRGGEV
ncbi:hypothetical protein BHM03_00034195 [Ensete ventricosum]|uniref:Uncharacterized protein n=1 Tax=Ensete ventricosum TaxID=4639 RepID=A0A445MJ53_ENSVE|nr:hypothetical protein BHM03_00034195 [Ensete ventricosum]